MIWHTCPRTGTRRKFASGRHLKKWLKEQDARYVPTIAEDLDAFAGVQVTEEVLYIPVAAGKYVAKVTGRSVKERVVAAGWAGGEKLATKGTVAGGKLMRKKSPLVTKAFEGCADKSKAETFGMVSHVSDDKFFPIRDKLGRQVFGADGKPLFGRAKGGPVISQKVRFKDGTSDGDPRVKSRYEELLRVTRQEK